MLGLLALHPLILGGTPSDASQDSTVMLVAVLPADENHPQTSQICTATLIAPRLLLTARHCVADTDQQVACGADGTPLLGATVKANRDPQNLYAFTGTSRPSFIGPDSSRLDLTQWKPSGRGAQIVDDQSGTLCNHDFALVLLENPIDNVPIAPVRLDGGAAAGEKLLTVGWGIVSDAVPEPPARQQRSGVTVTRLGPDSAIPVLTKNEFGFDESICEGDSGGPIFAQASGAVVGVVSRGSNGNPYSTFTSTCTQADNIGTSLAPFRDVLDRGFALAGAAPKLEVKPDDSGCRTAPGETPRTGTWLGIGLALATLVRRARR